MIANYWRELSTIDGKAAALGRAEVFFGDYQRAFSLPRELALITSAEIQTAAADIFDRNRMTIGVLRSPVAEDSE